MEMEGLTVWADIGSSRLSEAGGIYLPRLALEDSTTLPG